MCENQLLDVPAIHSSGNLLANDSCFKLYCSDCLHTPCKVCCDSRKTKSL